MHIGYYPCGCVVASTADNLTLRCPHCGRVMVRHELTSTEQAGVARRPTELRPCPRKP